jgi:hypothetical protein
MLARNSGSMVPPFKSDRPHNVIKRLAHLPRDQTGRRTYPGRCAAAAGRRREA